MRLASARVLRVRQRDPPGAVGRMDAKREELEKLRARVAQLESEIDADVSRNAAADHLVFFYGESCKKTRDPLESDTHSLLSPAVPVKATSLSLPKRSSKLPDKDSLIATGIDDERE